MNGQRMNGSRKSGRTTTGPTMNGRRLLACAGLLGCCLLNACGTSPPARYYTLSDTTPAAVPSSASWMAAARAPMVELEPVLIPAELDRIEVVSRLGPNRVHIADLDRWAAPLDDQLRLILWEDLSRRLPPHQLAEPNEPGTSEPRQRLFVRITDFLGDRRCAVTLRADWTLRGPAAHEERGSENVHWPGAGDCSGVAAAQMSEALGMLADRLAGVILSRSPQIADDSAPLRK
jgi:uncharacterized lipoprotein YmbA